MSETEQLLQDDAYSQGSRITSRTDVSPKTISALIRRVRALVRRLIDHEVEESSIVGAEGIISQEVVLAFHELGGDFVDALPFSLLQARKNFLRDASDSHSDASLNELRAVACEVIARRLVAKFERDSYDQGLAQGGGSHLSLTKKFTRVESDGDISIPTSALESAIDQHCTTLLSSTEVQRAVQAIWSGQLVQKYGPDGHSYFEPYESKDDGAFLNHFHPSRLGVPKYAYCINIVTWIFFLAIFTVQTRVYKSFDFYEALLWVMAAGYLAEDVSRWFKIGGIDAVSFWTVLDLATDLLFTSAFALRMASFIAHGDNSEFFQLRAFQLLACVAPLVWIQLLKLFDGFVYFGTLQVIILRMMKESAIFFTLLVLVCIGFFHALYALDAADEDRVADAATRITDALIQALLGGADFDLSAESFGYPFGHILYYAYCFTTAVVLLNILIAFFGTAYSEVVDAASEVYCGFFSEKVVSMVRAPDQFVYPPPFNLIEAFLVAPLEYVLPHSYYSKLNYYLQSVLFGIPLFIIAFYESRLARKVGGIVLEHKHTDQEEAEACGERGTLEDPEVPEDEINQGMKISKTSFEQLVKMINKSKKDEQ
ncbi:hypothetical protein IE53DRAFT_176641 [Violaceomyces palustris]|uniref:Uncharacterized protein n=1 Tax=Violaceomyces palustris TaxID=1673888 RepID=A0ACD0NSS4_9BASI|nr:hypothetical protein IE53DRAFT_176641 [Violaceomyces palustris]